MDDYSQLRENLFGDVHISNDISMAKLLFDGYFLSLALICLTLFNTSFQKALAFEMITLAHLHLSYILNVKNNFDSIMVNA